MCIRDRNTILFIVFIWLQLFIVIGYSISEVGVRPSGHIAIGFITALLISYALVKKINKSQFWANIFFSDKSVKEGNSKQFSNIWFIWLILVCIWNFGWPNVKPLYDVIVAIILSIGAYQLKKIL